MSKSVNNSQAISIWANLRLCKSDEQRLTRFFVDKVGIKRKFVKEKLHITVYHARRPMPGLSATFEPADFTLSIAAARFMLLGPGGENPRPDLNPNLAMVGFRVQGRDSEARRVINGYRSRLLQYETPEVLGSMRQPSTKSHSAFGARCFQPHMTLLKEGSGVNPSLNVIGTALRTSLEELKFDVFEIQIKTRTRI